MTDAEKQMLRQQIASDSEWKAYTFVYVSDPVGGVYETIYEPPVSTTEVRHVAINAYPVSPVEEPYFTGENALQVAGTGFSAAGVVANCAEAVTFWTASAAEGAAATVTAGATLLAEPLTIAEASANSFQCIMGIYKGANYMGSTSFGKGLGMDRYLNEENNKSLEQNSAYKDLDMAADSINVVGGIRKAAKELPKALNGIKSYKALRTITKASGRSMLWAVIKEKNISTKYIATFIYEVKGVANKDELHALGEVVFNNYKFQKYTKKSLIDLLKYIKDVGNTGKDAVKVTVEIHEGVRSLTKPVGVTEPNSGTFAPDLSGNMPGS